MSKKTKRARASAPPAAASPPAAATRPRERLYGLALAALSGAGWFLSCADFDIWPLAWITAVPVLYAIERASTTRRAVLFGWFSGLVANAGGFYWIIGLLERFGHLPWIVAALLFLMLCAYQAIVFALFAWATRAIRQSTRLPMALIAPLVMVTFELSVPFIFPWYLAITQAWQLHVIQVADLAGPLGVTALIMMVNGAIYDVATERRARLLAAGAAAGVLVAALGYGHLRIGQMEKARAAAPKIQVGVVQPNVAFDQKGVDHQDLATAQFLDLLRLSQELEAEGADLIVWTESSYPFWIARPHGSEEATRHGQRIRKRFKAPLVMGAVTHDPANPDGYPHNTALMLDSDGRFTQSFDKIFLLMFGEYIPGLETFPFIKKLMPKAAGHFARGKEIVTFPFEHEGTTYRLGPMICYEDILPSFGRKLAAMRPHLMVNITNDAWFGDTSEPWEHLALSVYRSVELRTELVRAVNTGVSAFIDATGRVRERTYAVDPAKDPRGADKKLGEVALIEGGGTVYAKVGDLFGYLNLLAVVWLWQVRPRLRRRPAA